tara:strand:- start:18917 stop:20272 length:1356 start_codon:yes stop_codon:yes gene_type:complete
MKKITYLVVWILLNVIPAFAEHIEGKAYIQTLNPLSQCGLQDSAVVTGQAWFDGISQTFQISSLREVQISCQVEFNIYHITFRKSHSVSDVCNSLNDCSQVDQAWPVMVFSWYGIPDDPYYDSQWGLNLIDAASAWDYESGKSTVIIGIPDSGSEVEYLADPSDPIHPDLENNLWNDNGLYGINLINQGEPPDDGLGHGTHVSGIVGAVTNNSLGVSGLAGGGFGTDNGVNLLIIKNGNDEGVTDEETLAESICQALNPDGNWNTEPDLAGYNIYKNEVNSGWILFRSLDLSQTSWTDNSVIIGDNGKFVPNVCYKISSFDITEQESEQSFPRCKPLKGISRQVTDNNPLELPTVFNISPPYPNPFNPTMNMEYSIKTKSQIKIVVYNIIGKQIKELKSGIKELGLYNITWNGFDDFGKGVSAGIYIIRLEALPINGEPMYVGIQKVILLK